MMIGLLESDHFPLMEIIEMHKIFGTNKGVEYVHRKGAYLIPIKNNCIGIVQTSKGLFFLGGGIDNEETDTLCIIRECLEEIGYSVLIKEKVCSAETYTKHSEIGYFHPIQTYYLGELVEQKQPPIESDHKLIWMDYDNLRGKMFLEMQNWALEQCWNTFKKEK